MSTGEDEPSPSLNGRLRPRKSIGATTPSPQHKVVRKTEGKLAQDRPKRTNAPSKASPVKQNDLLPKSDSASATIFLCPYCDRKFNTRQTASKHARRIHLSISKQDNFIKCLYCNHSDAEANAIIKHMVDSHPNQYFACLDCHTRFPSTTELAEHKHNVCEKQKPTYRSKLRHKTSPGVKRNPKKSIKSDKTANFNESTQLSNDLSFNGIVISCELKPSDMHDADIEDKITTNLILPSSKTLGSTTVEKNAVIVLDDLQWNKRIPSNFSFHNADADQILSRLGVVHRSPRVGESRKDLIRMMDEPNEKFEKCFDTSFYSRVTKNVQENLAKYLDGTFNFNPHKDTTIKTRKSKASVMINTAEGFPILLAQEQFSRNLFDGFIPRGVAPKHKWKWDTADTDKNILMLLDQTKRDSHVNSCIISLISSLDMWTQLRMKSKFEDIFKTTPTAKKTEKQNLIGMELKEILESRDIPSSSQLVQYKRTPVESNVGSELPTYLGLHSTSGGSELRPAVLSGEWVRPRCYVCCACGDQTRDARTLTTHLTTHHPNAQVQHYEIVGETLLSADILKHLYVPPSQITNRTRPPRGFRDCTKCNKSITLEHLHQHMLDCAGDTPTVRRKCRYRPFGVRRRRPRLPDNTIRKKMRKDIRSRHRQKSHMRPRSRIRTEVGDAETIRKMIADLPAKRNRITSTNVLRPRRTVLKTKKQVKVRSLEDKQSKHRPVKKIKESNQSEVPKKQNDTDNSSTVDEDDQPLKLSATRVLTRTGNEALRRRATLTKTKKKKRSRKQNTNMEGLPPNYYSYNTPPDEINPELHHRYPINDDGLNQDPIPSGMSQSNVFRPTALRPDAFLPYHPYYYCPNQLPVDQEKCNGSEFEQRRRGKLNTKLADRVQNESTLESTNQRIDVKNAGPSNIKQHGSRNGTTMQNGKQRSNGRGDDSNQNNNINKTPDVPLKHSIASLTSDTEGCDSSIPYHHPHSLQSEISTTFTHESADGRKVFENEVSVLKVDKPPLLNDTHTQSKHRLNTTTQSKKPDEQQPVANNFIEVGNLNAYTLPPNSRNLIVSPISENVSESRAANDKKILHKDSSGQHGSVRQLPLLDNYKEPRKCIEEKPTLMDTKELAGLNREYNETHSNAEITKIETDKSKSSKTRKGLNDCIAMLRTKSLRIDISTSKQGDDENIDIETVDSEVKPTTVRSSPSLSASKNTKKNPRKRTKTAKTRPSFAKDGDAPTSRCISTGQLLTQTENTPTCLQKDKKPVDNTEVSLTVQQREGESHQTRSTNSTKSEIKSKHSPAEGTVTEPSDVLVCSNSSSDDESKTSEELECVYYPNRENQTVKPIINFDMPNLTQAMIKAQDKLMKNKEGVDIDLLHEYSYRIVDEMQRRQSESNSALMLEEANAQAVQVQVVSTTPQVVSIAAQTDSQITQSQEELIDSKMASRQPNVSPTPRRTKRKPIKKIANSEQLKLKNEPPQSIPQAPTSLSPQNNDLERFGASPPDSNMRLHNTTYLPEESPSHETLPLKTPLPANAINLGKETYKRVLNSPCSPSDVENRDNVTLSTVRKSPETPTENIINMPNLSSHSIESANAQNITANYDTLMAQIYRDQYEKALISISQSSQGISHPRETSPDECINDNARYDKSNELHSHYPSNSVFVPINHDKQRSMQGNPTPLSRNVDKSNICETQNPRKFTSVQQQISTEKKYLEKRSDFSINVSEHVDKYSRQESKAIKQNIETLHVTPHTRRPSELFYTHPSAYHSNVPNIRTLDHSLDVGFEGRKETHDNALRAYHESVASFAVPTATYSNNGLLVQRNTVSLIPSLSCEPNMEDMAPLDLSCEAKTRKDQTLNLTKKNSDVSKNTCDIPISIEKKTDDVSMTPDFGRYYSEQLRNLSRHALISPESEQVKGPVHKLDGNESQCEKIKNNEMPTQESMYQPALNTTNYADLGLIDRSLKDSSIHINYTEEKTNKIPNVGIASNYSINQLQSLPPDCNYFMPHDSQKSKAIYRQESKLENTFLDSRNVSYSAAQTNAGSKFEDKTSKKKSPCASTNVDYNVETNNLHGSHLHKDRNLTPINVSPPNAPEMNSQNNDIHDIEPRETNSQINNHKVFSSEDNAKIEQDADDARIIAMLPVEIVEILDNIPKNHRNQLLNVLPQYVSNPLSNVGNDTKNLLPATDILKNKSLAETQQTSTCSDSTILSVNTAISPSSVIPKKRHSPSHSKGRLNSGDSQPSGPILPPPLVSTLPQRSPIGHNESANNSKSSLSDQLGSSIKTHHFESMVKKDFDCNTSQKDRADIKLNYLNEPAHINRNNEVLAPAGIDFIPTAPTQELTVKLPTKQKLPNEQTASLRAVRIKTTATKKSFSDDKKLLVSGCYTTNEKLTNSGQISIGHQACNINRNDLKYEHAKLNSKQIENNYDDDANLILRNTISQNTDSVEAKSKTTKTVVISDTNIENHLNFTHSVPLVSHTEVSQKKPSITSHDTHEDSDLVKNTVTLELSSFVPLQDNTTCNFLEQTTSVSSSEGLISKEEKSAINFKNKTCDNESKKDSENTTPTKFAVIEHDFKSEINTKVLVGNINNIESKGKECADDNNTEVLQKLSLSNEKLDEGQELASKDEIYSKTFVSSLESKIKNVCELSSKNEKSNEDDSEDDVTLAVIKQKHCKIDSKVGKKTSKQSKTSAILKSKDKEKQLKIASKRQTKKLSKNTGIIRNDISDDVTDEFIQPANTEKKINDVNDIKNITFASMDPINTPIDKANEFDVNKENNIMENINKSKENDDSLIHEHNEIENTLDNYTNKNELKEMPNTNIDVHNHFQSERLISPTSDEVQDLQDLNVKRNEKLKKTYVSVEENIAQIKKINTSEDETKSILSDIDPINELSVFDSINSKTKPKECTDVSIKDSTKVTYFSTPIDSDLKLCSEIAEVNTLPLRRSRRGKSMYVDGSYLDDSEQLEDCTKKTPLTMKRLILSRVEKDKKRNSESSILEKSCNATDDHLSKSITSDDLEKTWVKKGTLTKRKKSPYSKRVLKKIKPTSSHEQEEELSDLSNLHSASESNSCILRELSNAGNKITEKDSCKEDLRCAPTDNTSSLSENTTIVSNEKKTCVVEDHLQEIKESDNSIEIKETTASVKRKLNTTKSSDVVSHKSKKTKYQKKKSQSDFDSDDDKVLLVTRQNIPNEKNSVDENDVCSISKEKDNSGKSPKSIDEAINDTPKQKANISVSNETRVTCYSRSIPNRKPRSSSSSLKDHANYDPYDIDFIDILETTGPIIKKKAKNVGDDQSIKLDHDLKLNAPKEDLYSSSLQVLKQNEVQSNISNDSDSDSSKSDVPLQKYVDSKTSKVDVKNKNNKGINDFTDSTEKLNTLASKQNTENSDDENPCSNNLNSTVAPIPCKGKKSIKRVNSDDSICESNTAVKDDISNINDIISIDETTQKEPHKQKKTRTPAAHNVDSAIVSNEEDQQLRSDKFMENFGFYSERIPRKSNLLASKKIAETFHMICNESDDSFFGYKEKSSRKTTQNENKKKSENGSNVITTQDLKTIPGDEIQSNFDIQSTEPRIDNYAKEPGDVRMDDSDLDSVTAQAIMDSEEVKCLENDLFSSFREAAEANAARNCFVGYQNACDLDMTAKAVDSLSQLEDKHVENPKNNENPEATKKSNRNKLNKHNYKEKMYPDIEEIDMFEDKFDKIKRKSRSQAVAAKQIQVVAEPSTSAKSRKQSERKRTSKSTRKNYQNTQVPTKGALKGFECIKISIPTHDLNMPINVSPPRQTKKRRKTTIKRKKESSDPDSSCSESDEKDKLERDIYEFKDSEDTELFDLRPSTVMDRFRSMHSKNKLKHKDKEKAKEEKIKTRDKERKGEVKDSINFETVKEGDKSTVTGNEKERKNIFSKEERRGVERKNLRDIAFSEKHFVQCIDEDSWMKVQKGSGAQSNNEVDNGKTEADIGIASTSGFIPDRIDESEYESENSSPEGDFIFYMSNDINCVCPSDNDSDDSDVERGCGKLNCVNKNRNADKNAAIENIFKNNAVRCEKPDTKEPENPRPNLDQLFDSLLETVSKSNNIDISKDEKGVILSSNTNFQRNTNLSPVEQHNWTECNEHTTSENKNIPIFDESYNTTKYKQSLSANSKHARTNVTADGLTPSNFEYISSLCQNDTDSGSMQIFSIDDKQKENLGYSLMTEESTQVNFKDIIAATKDDKNFTNIVVTKTNELTTCDIEDEFDIDKPETLNRQYMHLILPAEKVSAFAQTENKLDYSDVETSNESAATKYIKGLSPSEAAKMEIYTMVSAQSTQTEKLKTHGRDSSKMTLHDDLSESKRENNIDMLGVPRNRIRLQKYDIRDIAHKSKSTKSIQTDKNQSYTSSRCVAQEESDDDVETLRCDRADKQLDLGDDDKSYRVSRSIFHEDNGATPPQDVDAFMAPASRSTADKHSPGKSDEGIGTSYDCSADTVDQSFDNAGVARQRARRKCTVGKQNILAEHWSSESEFDGAPPRPNSADSVVASAPRKKKSRKKEGHHTSGRKASRHLSKSESKAARGRAASGGRSEDGEASGGGGSGGSGGSGSGSGSGGQRAPPGPKIRVRAAHHYCSSESEEAAGPQPQHGWIVGDSHKKLVTMLAHAKGRKRNNADKHLD